MFAINPPKKNILEKKKNKYFPTTGAQTPILAIMTQWDVKKVLLSLFLTKHIKIQSAIVLFYFSCNLP